MTIAAAMTTGQAATELVVAHFEEDLAWINNVPRMFAVCVYDKSALHRRTNSIVLTNLGREAHSYLHHIVTRYDSLAPLTVFCQGKPFDHAYDFHKTLLRLADGHPIATSFEWLGHIIDTDDARGRTLFVQWSKNSGGEELALDEFHEALLGRQGPAHYIFRPGGQFAVSDACIRRRPRSFYEKALDLALSFPHAAHCFERCWGIIFGTAGAEAALLAGRKTAYLKPIRRLQPGR